MDKSLSEDDNDDDDEEEDVTVGMGSGLQEDLKAAKPKEEKTSSLN